MSYLIKSLMLLILLGVGPILIAQDDSDDSAPLTPDSSPQDDPQIQPDPSSDNGMTLDRLNELLHQLDGDLIQDGPSWQLEFQGRLMIVIADGSADRMRIMTPVTETSDLDQAELYRLLQANFDSALDARYAVAQDVLWSVFIHPLSPLDEAQLANALFQVYSAAATFGTSYSSGQFTYGGGDSNGELEKLQEELDRLIRPRT